MEKITVHLVITINVTTVEGSLQGKRKEREVEKRELLTS